MNITKYIYVFVISLMWNINRNFVILRLYISLVRYIVFLIFYANISTFYSFSVRILLWLIFISKRMSEWTIVSMYIHIHYCNLGYFIFIGCNVFKFIIWGISIHNRNGPNASVRQNLWRHFVCKIFPPWDSAGFQKRSFLTENFDLSVWFKQVSEIWGLLRSVCKILLIF